MPLLRSESNLNVIGLDVGFSEKRPTSGVAHLVGNNLNLARATSEKESRTAIFHNARPATVTAIDAPILHSLHWNQRNCERIFSFGLFQKRCKPGHSHVRGTGRKLRKAGHDTANQLLEFTSSVELRNNYPQIWPQKNIVEAFPNSFLGVLLPDLLTTICQSLKEGRSQIGCMSR